MGAWDETALGNDDALDFKTQWDDFIADNIQRWGAEKIYRFYKDIYYDGKIPSDDLDYSNEIIALGQLFLDNELEIPKALVHEISIVVTLNLDPDELDEWNSPSKRRTFLKGYLNEIGGEFNKSLIKELHKPEIEKYKNEIKNYRLFFENIDEIVQVRKTMKSSTFDLVNSLYPDIAKTLDEIYAPSTPGTYRFTLEVEAWRTKFIAWWTGFILELEPEEVIKLIDAAERKNTT
ncbi:hypothetical protein [Psychrobium sp. 1_MG-2023]|uniref:hypothetical protein n=1 Tax=Psychrobium sp. 1_MG-2023 TaxID=3062624 RepID=UPI000C329B8C|nr:hypothetical protein [Psychrobium sp. 1_MG-2023]MDP2562333.1 hypothetical protein [Psychrobium sp. 1_MG-2023]PKF58057.1 hypothetical protein CW748_04455 [Alteromonadales bacterium alter-6D02]